MKTEIKKAVITAAGKGTRQYPATNAVQKELFPVVDVDGITKPTIQVIAEQVFNAGIEEIAIIVQPGEEKQFIAHFQGLSVSGKKSFQNKEWGIRQSELLEKLSRRITYIHQTSQEGFGHAVYCAHKWVGEEPFLLLLGDHIYLSSNQDSCIKQAINGFNLLQKTVFAVKQTPADLLYLFGTVAGEPVDGKDNLYKITSVYEKPSADYARLNLKTAGLADDSFLAFFGMYLFTPTIFEVLGDHIKNNIRSNNEIQLATAQAELCKTEGAYALEIDGERLDMGTPFGYLETLAKLALNGKYRKEFKKIVEI